MCGASQTNQKLAFVLTCHSPNNVGSRGKSWYLRRKLRMAATSGTNTSTSTKQEMRTRCWAILVSERVLGAEYIELWTPVSVPLPFLSSEQYWMWSRAAGQDSHLPTYNACPFANNLLQGWMSRQITFSCLCTVLNSKESYYLHFKSASAQQRDDGAVFYGSTSDGGPPEKRWALLRCLLCGADDLVLWTALNNWRVDFSFLFFKRLHFLCSEFIAISLCFLPAYCIHWQHCYSKLKSALI